MSKDGYWGQQALSDFGDCLTIDTASYPTRIRLRLALEVSAQSQINSIIVIVPVCSCFI
jgi:hypothetical protein